MHQACRRSNSLIAVKDAHKVPAGPLEFGLRAVYNCLMLFAPKKTQTKRRKPHWTKIVKPTVRKCKECGKRFKTVWPRKIYCSLQCGEAYRERKR